ncbi:MAG: hypothetical protein LBR88_08205 [Zoogloeaceae bacterium]|nr:hypothetical protein [Zoogloeaceae bacterium]
MMSGVKADITEYYAANGKFPWALLSVYNVWQTASIPKVVGNAVDSVVYTETVDDHHIGLGAQMKQSIFPGTACGIGFPCTIGLYGSTSPDAGSITWTCRRVDSIVSVFSKTTLPDKWLPAACRGK